MADLAMVTLDCADPQALAAFWTQALGTTVADDWGGFVVLAGQPAVGLQRVPDPTPGKNRVHLDLRAADRRAEVQRLVGLGARELADRQAPGLEWTVLADPEGNVFCVAGS